MGFLLKEQTGEFFEESYVSLRGFRGALLLGCSVSVIIGSCVYGLKGERSVLSGRGGGHRREF